MNASPITKISSWLKFLGKNLHLVGCAIVCGKSEFMLLCMHVSDFFEGIYLSRQTNQREVSLNMKDSDVPNEQGGFNKRAE